MKKTAKLLGFAHLVILIAALTCMLFQIALFDMLSLAIIGLVGMICFFSLGALRLDNLIQISFGFIAGLLPYLLTYTIYFAPTFIKNNWHLLMVLMLILLFKALLVLNDIQQNGQKIYAGIFAIALCPLIFALGNATLWNLGFVLVILCAIAVVIVPKLKKS